MSASSQANRSKTDVTSACTLKPETASPPASTLIAQQRRFDRFRQQFNHDRPQEALANATPASIHTPSQRRVPQLIPSFHYPFCESRLVDEKGRIQRGARRLFIGSALANEVVGIQHVREHYLGVLFGPITLGLFDERQLHRGLLRFRVDHRKPSAMFPV